ncbi:D-arabinono-1,4-lactone oxidase [Austwickia chelonae]|uniref:Putative FAD-linked oxidase n=1 Tax=Austwickia chelonae NBRC 105200 TaxID=1184607 RepID=K6UNZ2_9MICO|nr:putative FAD-linked oxidase [Austwickia chelonae NBRC 105200]
MAWRNWAGTVEAFPVRRVSVRDEDEVVAVLRGAVEEGLRVKAVGAGHSFTGAAYTDGVLVDLSALAGLRGVVADGAGARVRVGAGTTLRELNVLLDESGLAVPNLGDIDAQTIAGAISTGTHGTGATFGGLSSFVTALRVVTADGRVSWCSRAEDPELFAAAGVGLGAFGVVVEVELACVPAFRVRAVESPERLSELLPRLDEVMTEHDHVEFFWFPYTDSCLVKRHDRLPPEDSSGVPLPEWRRLWADDVVDNRLFAAANRAVVLRPSWVPTVNQVGAKVISRREYTDVSHRVFVSPRTVRFRESEYAVPRDAVGEALVFLRDWFERTGEPVTFPLEVRYTAADDLWLSTASGRDTAYIAVHQYVGQDHTRVFRVFEDVMDRCDGRPHWGKLHRLTADRLAALYPRFGDALRVRDRVDPGRLFANPYLDRVLGE